MAYWFVAGTNPGASKQVQFYMDSDSDVVNLPTTTSNGVKQEDDVSYLPCGKGSSALSIESGKVFMLNSNDGWIEFGG